MTFVSMSSVPEGCTIEKAGIIATTDASIADLENDGAAFTDKSARFVRGDVWSGSSYRYSWTVSGLGDGITIYVRAYLVYTDEDGNSHTEYGPVEYLAYTE